MRPFLLAGWAVCAGPALAADWHSMDRADIARTLTGTRLVYADAWQEFEASGQTIFNAGSDSAGRWRAGDDRYCSQWPPADGWACYVMERDAETGALRFIGPSGDFTEGTIAR